MNKRIPSEHYLLCLDLLLPISVSMFLWPDFNPTLSTLPVFLWLIINLLFVRNPFRHAAWIFAFMMLTASPNILVNSSPHPLSLSDSVVFCVAIYTSAFVKLPRLKNILLMLLFSCIPIVFFLGSRPWAPNVLAGVNQCAYLIGIVLLSSAFLLVNSFQSKRIFWVAVVFAPISSYLLWLTGSRSSLISIFVAVFVFIVARFGFVSKVAKWLYAISALAVVLSLLRTAHLYIKYSANDGSFFGSELGRLGAARCYALLPFGDDGSLWYGSGYLNLKELCSGAVNVLGSIPDHAHNIYLQVWAAAGIFGSMSFLVLLLAYANILNRPFGERYSTLMSSCMSFFAYVAISGVFDVSSLHWPVTIFWSGFVIGIAFAESAVSPRRL